MASLRLALAIALLPAAPLAAQPARWSGEIAEASGRFGVPPDWIRRVIQVESGGRTNWLGQPVVSSAGALGLMQLMPGTWREVRATLGLGPNPHDPRDNILAGTFYLRSMYDRFGYPGLFAAYNAGPARYAEHLATGRPLPAETIAYSALLAGSPGPQTAPTSRGRPSRLLSPLWRRKGDASRASAAAPIFVLLSSERPAQGGGS